MTLYRVTTKGSVISADFANFEPYQSSRRLQFSLEELMNRFKLDSCERLMQLVNYEDTILCTVTPTSLLEVINDHSGAVTLLLQQPSRRF